MTAEGGVPFRAGVSRNREEAVRVDRRLAVLGGGDDDRS